MGHEFHGVGCTKLLKHHKVRNHALNTSIVFVQDQGQSQVTTSGVLYMTFNSAQQEVQAPYSAFTISVILL